MRRLTILVICAALIYSAYWFVGARATQSGVQSALDAANAEGWSVTYTDIQTRGYPSRFDTTLTELMIKDPAETWIYSVDFAQAFALSYAPNQIIAALADNHVIEIGSRRWTIQTDGLRASAKVAATSDLTFETATAEVGAVTITGQGPGPRFASALIALRAQEAASLAHDLYGEVLGLTFPDTFMAMVSPDGALPATMPRIAADTLVTLDRPIDRTGFSTPEAAPQITRLDIRTADASWGNIALNATGSLVIDELGKPTGEIALRLTGWTQLITALTNLGAIDPGVAPTWQQMAATLAQGNDTIDLPITFQDGVMRAGFLPLGPAPRFR